MVLLNRETFLEQFNFVYSMRYDLPDTLTESLKEIRQELKDMDETDDYTGLAEWLNDSLLEEGFPALI